MTDTPLFAGIDFGTSGCRAVAIDAGGTLRAEVTRPLPAPQCREREIEQHPGIWTTALEELFGLLVGRVPPGAITAVAVDGTSGTVLLADRSGTPLGPALMYNDARAAAEAERMKGVVPRESAAHGTASGLAKLLWLLRHTDTAAAAHVLTQADYINGVVGDIWDVSDANNVLKLGYNPHTDSWPPWLDRLEVPRTLLPRVVRPGTPIGTVAPTFAARHGLRDDVMLVAGTTDGTAAFLATGASRPGEAVTSLGSTLVLKLLSDQPLYAPEYGIYSQPLGDLWLVGGGSNSGGAVLRHYFSDAAMAALTPQLRPQQPTGLDYYPLLSPGERFPVADPTLAPRLTPRPEEDAVFFQGLLEGIARIEQQGYRRLAELGAPYPLSVRSVGGGAKNPGWTAIRASLLGVPLLNPQHTEAAYGTALLARQGWQTGRA